MTKNIRNILIPVNFSESSESALKTGIAMCKRHHSVLHLLFVKEENQFVYPPGKNPKLLEMILEAEQTTQNKLEHQSRQIEEENGITCFYHTAEGSFHRAVAATAEDFYCDLIILEKTKSHSLFSFLKQNSAYKILKEVKCPVLTIPAQKKFLNFKNVLFPVRPVLAGLDKLEIALPIIKRNNSKVILFSPVHKKKLVSDLSIVNELVNRAYYRMSVNNVDIEKEMNFTDDMALEVINKAVEKKSDLIIITATLKKGFNAVFYRNYTEKVIDTSPVPVLSVKLK